MSDVLARIRRCRILPVIVLDDPAAAAPLARALEEGGLPCAEITFRTVGAAEALRRITAEFPTLLVGAGTVLSARQVDQARDAGAQFIVSPGFNAAVVERCREHEIPVYPGVCTPTEVEMGLELGLEVLKFFPAEAMGGVAYLKAISAPYPGLEFIPTGGIDVSRLPDYLGFDRVVACGGSWMVPAAWIRAGEFDRIRDETRIAVKVAGTFRDQE